MAAAQGGWLNGAHKALQNYVNEAANVAGATANVITSGLSAGEDAWLQFLKTGKLSLKTLGDIGVMEINRIIFRQQVSNALGVGGSGGGGGLMGLIGAGINLLGGGTSVAAAAASALPGDSLDNFLSISGLDGRRAAGGAVAARGLYEVNERGPEVLTIDGRSFLMMGTRSGYVTPNGGASQRQAAAPASNMFNVTVAMPRGASRETAVQFGRDVARQISVAQARNG